MLPLLAGGEISPPPTFWVTGIQILTLLLTNLPHVILTALYRVLLDLWDLGHPITFTCYAHNNWKAPKNGARDIECVRNRSRCTAWKRQRVKPIVVVQSRASSWAQTVELIHPVQSPTNELGAVNFSPTTYTGKYWGWFDLTHFYVSYKTVIWPQLDQLWYRCVKYK